VSNLKVSSGQSSKEKVLIKNTR